MTGQEGKAAIHRANGFGAGADTLECGGGNDTLTGGTVADTFGFDTDDGADSRRQVSYSDFCATGVLRTLRIPCTIFPIS